MANGLKRQCNIELLRILAMLMIVDVHYFNGIQTTPGTANHAIFQVYETLGICGVDLFVLITGYFSVSQKELKFRKIVNILVDVAFWEFIGFMLCVLAGWTSFSFKELIRGMFPTFFGGRWFVQAYLILLLFIPFLNLLIQTITRRAYVFLLCIVLFLFSFWPSFLPNPPFDDFGYSFVHMITLYLIAGYLRLYGDKLPPKRLCLAGFVLNFGIVLLSAVLERGYAWAYNYPFVMLEALSLFLLFLQLKIRSKVINRLAACAFGVYLIHTNAYFNSIGYDRLYHRQELVNGDPWLFALSVAGSILFFYVLGFFLESAKKLLFSFTVDPLLNAIPFLNRPYVIDRKEEP